MAREGDGQDKGARVRVQTIGAFGEVSKLSTIDLGVVFWQPGGKFDMCGQRQVRCVDCREEGMGGKEGRRGEGGGSEGEKV